MNWSDTIAGLIGIAMSVAVGIGTLSFPILPSDHAGPAIFPRTVSVGMFICCLLLIRSARKPKGEKAAPAAEEAATQPTPARLVNLENGAIRLCLAMSVTLLYPVLITLLGFSVVTLLMSFFLVLIMARGRIWPSIGTALTLTAIAWFVFGYLLEASLPKGFLF